MVNKHLPSNARPTAPQRDLRQKRRVRARLRRHPRGRVVARQIALPPAPLEHQTAPQHQQISSADCGALVLQMLGSSALQASWCPPAQFTTAPSWTREQAVTWWGFWKMLRQPVDALPWWAVRQLLPWASPDSPWLNAILGSQRTSAPEILTRMARRTRCFTLYNWFLSERGILRAPESDPAALYEACLDGDLRTAQWLVDVHHFELQCNSNGDYVDLQDSLADLSDTPIAAVQQRADAHSSGMWAWVTSSLKLGRSQKRFNHQTGVE